MSTSICAAGQVQALDKDVAWKVYFSGGLFALGEWYAQDERDLEPLDQFLAEVIQSGRSGPRRAKLQMAREVLGILLHNQQSLRRALHVAEQHYDLGNDLFRAMLDPSMSYTCGYWRAASDLAEAQQAKLTRLCERLQLQPGMRILDIGCGWGNLAEYAARKYGVEVVGITISQEQATVAAERCADLPVSIKLLDYRAITGQFDAVVSVEMIEAVGRKNLKTYFDVVAHVLKPGGRFVLQAISADTFTTRASAPLDEFVLWLRHYIFPNGYLPRLDELVEPARRALVLEEVENFGPDYDRTLMAWERNFEANWPKLRGHYGEQFRRRWRYYLMGCAALFRLRMVQVYQIVYSRQS